jgi:hypothetical protein
VVRHHGELVEHRRLGARGLGAMAFARALLEPVESLTVARGTRENDAAGVGLGVAAVHVELDGLALLLEMLEPRVRGDEVRAGHDVAGRADAGGRTRVVALGEHAAQETLARQAVLEARGVRLASLVLGAPAQVVHAAQRKPEAGGGHAAVIGRPRPARSPLDGCPTAAHATHIRVLKSAPAVSITGSRADP